VRDRVVELVKEARPWYAPVARFDGFVIFCSFVALLFLVASILPPAPKPPPATSAAEQAQRVAISLAWAAGFILAMLAAYQLRVRYFPVSTFALGRGEQRFDLDEKVRWSVIVATALSGLGALAKAFFLP
jgi:hypothetical protein